MTRGPSRQQGFALLIVLWTLGLLALLGLGVGSLVLAVRDKATKRWAYAGHVGTGFDAAALKSLYETMQPLRIGAKPFDQRVRYENATTWLRPQLVGEVKFTEWTSNGEMRHPTFRGLRTDKKSREVTREQA